MTFAWDGSDDPRQSGRSIIGYEWALNDQTGTTTATSRTFTGLAVGSYVFRVRAVDDEGGTSYWASRSFSVTADVAVPQLALSTALLSPGESVTIGGSGYTASGDVVLSIIGPSGFDAIDSHFSATPDGEFTTSFSANTADPSGTYSVVARDEATGRYSPAINFRVEEGPEPTFALRITKPAPGENARIGSGGQDGGYRSFGGRVLVEWEDQMLRIGNPESFVNSVFRSFRYRIDLSEDGGATWPTTLGYRDGIGIYDEIKTISETVEISNAVSSTDYRIRVTDELTPSSFDISGPFSVTDESASGIDAEFVWDYSYEDYEDRDSPVLGVAADGVARFLVKVTDRLPDDGCDVQSVSVALSDPFSPSSTTPQTLGRVKRVGDLSETTGWSDAASTGERTTLDPFGPLPGADGEFWFWYRAPDDFNRLPEDVDRAGRTVLVTITPSFSAIPCSTEPLLRPIEVVRPPLMLVHGFNGGPDDWDDLRGRNGKLFKDDPRFRARLVPQMAPGGGFDENAEKLLGPPRGQGGKSFSSAVSLLREQGYAANLVDYVGHSMGGLMLRAAIDVPSGAPDYRTLANYNKGYVYRAVTLDTPHNGTELANMLVDITDEINGVFGSGVQELLYFMRFIGLSYFYEFCIPFDRSACPTAAIEHIQANGRGYGLEATATPAVHIIGGDIAPGLEDYPTNQTESFRAETVIKALMTALISPVLAETLEWEEEHLRLQIADAYLDIYGVGDQELIQILDAFGEKHGEDEFATNGDVIVALPSQLAGLGRADVATTVYDGVSHSSTTSSNYVTGNTEVGHNVDELLNYPASNDAYRAGFPAQPYGNAPTARGRDQLPLRSAPGRLSLSAPVSGTGVTVGDVLPVSIQVADTTGFVSLNVLFQQESIGVSAVAPTVNLALPVTGAVLDSVTVLALATFAYPDSVVLASASQRVYVDPGTSPVSFSVDDDLHLLTVGDEVRPEYEAVFPTFLAQPGENEDALLVTGLDASVVAFEPEFKAFRAVGEGSTLAVLNYRGVADTLRFSVGEAPPQAGLSVSIEPVGSPIEIPAGGGTFDYRVTLTNPTDGPLTFDGWTDVTLPNGSPYGPVAGPVRLTVQAGATRQFTLRQSVPAFAPAGTYTYTARVGSTFPATEQSDSFPFAKLPPAARPTSSAALATGTPEESAPRTTAQLKATSGIEAAAEAKTVPSAQPDLQPDVAPSSAPETDDFVFDVADWPVVDLATGLPFGAEAAARGTGDEAALDEAETAEIETAPLSVALPTEPALYPAYPNPFTSSTTIRYDLAEAGHVRLAVYDALGRRVALLADGQQQPGRYQATFDASRLASSVYVVRMRTPDYVETHRLTLIR
ncbi:MAG: T9SS type A sorting domain-containing protein [Bacteroidota bacterium]